MPRTPILARTILYQRLEDGSFRLSDWCLVTTSLGDMVEARSLVRPFNRIQDEDYVDASFTTLRLMPTQPSGNYALDQLGYTGGQWPHLRAVDPGVSQ